MLYSVSPALYEETYSRLAEAIGGRNYFSGSISFPFEHATCRLTTSVIVYRRTESLPEGDFEVIHDLVPVWWEFHTETDEGEVPNDFSFSGLRSRF
ncbi:MAG: hypothetical protein NC250_04660 [Alistipes senegalensis]|nr:hypothetical protein [Bacteroides cellulosilyticus]MCM1352001.1 hypothetical protein [Alistipes senegalensis]